MKPQASVHIPRTYLLIREQPSSCALFIYFLSAPNVFSSALLGVHR